MNFLSDVITYVRRIIKSPSDAVITDALIIDYINRFWIMDVDARMQLFDLKTKYQFQTQPGVDQYNMPLYSIQSETPGNPAAQDIAMYPMYQGFLGPAYVNGVQMNFTTQKNEFFNAWPNVVQYVAQVATGNGSTGPYSIQIPVVSNQTTTQPPVNALLRGHCDIAGIIQADVNDPPLVTSVEIAALDPFIEIMPVTSVFPAFYLTSTGAQGQNIIVSDSGQFLTDNVNCGLLIQPGQAPLGNLPLVNGPVPNYSPTQNVINYLTGQAIVYFPTSIPVGMPINAQCYYFQTGLPNAVLFYNNVLTLRSPPDRQYLVELDAYLTPAAFFATGQALPFAYMAEYIARGAARKILADTGDTEQFMFYEPLFKEQEILVWKRSQRQFTSTRTQTIYSQGAYSGYGFNGLGGGNSL